MSFVKHQLTGFSYLGHPFAAPENVYIGMTDSDRGYIAYKLGWNNKFIIVKPISNAQLSQKLLVPVTYKGNNNTTWEYAYCWCKNCPVFSGTGGYLYQGYQYVYISQTIGYELMSHTYYEDNVQITEWDTGFRSERYATIGDEPLTLTGLGDYDGQTIVLSSLYDPSLTIYESNSQFSEYTKVGDASSHWYLGSRYWTDSNSNRYVLGPYDNSLSDYPKREISGTERVYDSDLHQIVYRIYKNNIRTHWWECTDYEPFSAQNYTYTYKALDGTTASDMTLNFAGYTDNTPFSTKVLFADFSRFM